MNARFEKLNIFPFEAREKLQTRQQYISLDTMVGLLELRDEFNIKILNLRVINSRFIPVKGNLDVSS